MEVAKLKGYDLKGFKVLFVFPNLNLATNLMPEETTRYAKPDSPHYGIAQLSSVLLENNVDVKVLDMRLGYDFDYLIKLIEEYKPQMIGFTLIATRIKICYAMINKIKDLYPNTITVAGGTHLASFKSKVFEECQGLDFGVKQEGELSFLQLIDKVINKDKNYSEVKGLLYKDSGAIIETENMPMVDNLDELPIPAYDLFELDKYYGWQRSVVPIVTSRGCPFKCVFCSINLTMGYKFRVRSPENVVKELEYWVSRGMKKFDINDDEFSFIPKRVEQICDLIVQKGLKIELRLFNGIRVNDVNPVLLQKMKQAGVTAITYGLESGSAKILKVIKKGITIEKALEAIDMTKKAGIETTANFIIGHPEETYEDALMTIELIKKVNADKINFNNAVPYPGTELYSWIEKNARFLINVEDYLSLSHPGKHDTPFFETDQFTKDQRVELIRKGIVAFRQRLIKTRVKEPIASIYAFMSKSDYIYAVGEILKTKPFVNKYVKPLIFRRYGVNATTMNTNICSNSTS